MTTANNTKTYALKKPDLTTAERALLRRAIACKRASVLYEKELKPAILGIVRRHGAVGDKGALFSLGQRMSYDYSSKVEKLEEKLKDLRNEEREDGTAKGQPKEQLEWMDTSALEGKANAKAEAARGKAKATLATDDEIPM